MTFSARRVPLPDEPEFPEPDGEPCPEPVTDGGGGITFPPRDVPRVLPEDGPRAVPEFPVEAPTWGGGGMTLLASERPPAPLTLRPASELLPVGALGGGGTTSWVPKIFPTIELKNDPLPVCVGGGGTTLGVMPDAPLSNRRRSWGESADGGGAITEGAGRLSFALRPDSRSGAETGGGTTATSFIRTRDGETSRPTTAGAGGITRAFNAGLERERSRETCVETGPITLGVKDGAAAMRPREILGAGAMMLGLSLGV